MHRCSVQSSIEVLSLRNRKTRPSHTSDFRKGDIDVTLPNGWRYGARGGTGLPVSVYHGSMGEQV